VAFSEGRHSSTGGVAAGELSVVMHGPISATPTRRLRVGGDHTVHTDHGLFAQIVKLRTSVLIAQNNLRETTAVADDQEGGPRQSSASVTHP
jgi:hypothetical protein